VLAHAWQEIDESEEAEKAMMLYMELEAFNPTVSLSEVPIVL